MDDHVCGNPDHDHDPRELEELAQLVMKQIDEIHGFVFNEVDSDTDISLIDVEMDERHAWAVQQHHNAFFQIHDQTLAALRLHTTRVLWMNGPSEDSLRHNLKPGHPGFTTGWWAILGIRSPLGDAIMTLDEEAAEYLAKALSEGRTQAEELWVSEGS